MPPRACIHELDVVELISAVPGWTPQDVEVMVPAGTRGTVVVDTFGTDAVEVEVVDPHSGAPSVFFSVSRSALRVVESYQPE